MRLPTFITLFILFFTFVILSPSYAQGDLILKFEPENMETSGKIIKLNISVENIPPKDSIETSESISKNNLDGGISGMQLYFEYPEENIEPIGFNWSEDYKDEQIKSYNFENGKFSLNIMFNEPKYDDKLIIGTVLFNPKKEGKITLNFSTNKEEDKDTALVSEYGGGYSGDKISIYSEKGVEYSYYPNTIFKSCEITINGIGSENISKKLSEDTSGEVSSYTGGAPKIINEINIYPNSSEPTVLVKEVNISEIEPNVSVVLSVNNKVYKDYTFLTAIFLVSLVSGAAFRLTSKI
ncbi:hypothetical protein [Methanococcus aeolicus]|uniref:hypothetical protein n=1 Tax=Methanococcus aeolicus TaxID=42879 RepID=UPI0021C86478|nr:hypothetical protein [Methanococcus aeolicus]UXM85203.1 hypothetical protein N6C89_02690 [Methanococcus aeolicus]